MESGITGFVRALRAAGAEASTAESIDAARAVALLGYAHRDDLKAALGAALAKSEAEKRIHDRVFEQYFALRPSEGIDGSQPAEDEDEDDGYGDADDDGSGDARRGADQRAADRANPESAQVRELLALAAAATSGRSGPALDRLRLALDRAATSAGVDDIRFATQASYLAQRMLEAMGIAALESQIAARLTDASPDSQRQADRLIAARDALRREARALIDQRFELYGRPATEAFLTDVAVGRALGRLSPADMARMKTAVTRMARRLAQRHSRRQRRQLRGRLDMRRTLRANAGNDGMPFSLQWQHRRRDKPRIVVVCDVSASVANSVRFLLLFLYALHDVVSDLRSFAFSNRLQDVSRVLETMPFDDAMTHIIDKVGNGSTDYGQAWADLHDRHLEAIDRRTTIIVLGDGRSNGTDPRLDLFAQFADRARRVLWLCPERPRRWGTGDSAMLAYRPFCTSAVWCATAADLERSLDAMLQAA